VGLCVEEDPVTVFRHYSGGRVSVFTGSALGRDGARAIRTADEAAAWAMERRERLFRLTRMREAALSGQLGGPRDGQSG
jgi:hypothetical protein